MLMGELKKETHAHAHAHAHTHTRTQLYQATDIFCVHLFNILNLKSTQISIVFVVTILFKYKYDIYNVRDLYGKYPCLTKIFFI